MLQRDAIDLFSRLDIDGIELTLGKTDTAPAIKEEHKEYLRTLKQVSIHAPFKLMYEDTPEIRQLIVDINTLYHSINAKNIVIHPNQIDDYCLFAGMAYSTENLTPRAKTTIEDYAEVLQRFPQAGLTLDVGHAISHGPQELEQLIQRFGNRIVQIHFHDYKNGEDHVPFCQTDNPAKYSAVKQFGVPVVIEQNFPTLDMECLKREIDCVRNYFSK